MADSAAGQENEHDSQSQQSSEESIDTPTEYTLTYFVEDNYHLITTSGLFAAIAVYLTRLSQELAVEAQYGIAGSLLVFLILMLVIIQNGFDTASVALGKGAYIDFGAVTTLLVGTSTLVYSVTTISTRYADEMTPILDISAVLIAGSIYSVYLIREFEKFEPQNIVQEVIRIAPLIAFALLYYIVPVSAELEGMNLGNYSYTIIPGIVLHFTLMISVLLAINLIVNILGKESLVNEGRKPD